MFWKMAERVTEKSMASRDLMPIATQAVTIEQDGVCYLGHVVTENAGKKLISSSSHANPFLPYESAMYVAEAGESHVCLLNKFPVISPHLLICSKDFVSQTQVLSLADFKAWLLGFDADDVLGFYNCGPVAGASQPHRHMQLVKTAVPLSELIGLGALPFEHVVSRSNNLDAESIYGNYLAALAKLQLGPDEHGECSPHNVLLSKDWLLVLPRAVNNIAGVFANGMNYSGRFLVKRKEQLEWLKQYGLLRFLAECSVGTNE
ncbi:phosphorylase [Photobacterium aquae]|uniref:Phosphorylase n=1 Tax=Photobacterium aquae TaxID=1195763 RepID=A0A0J1HAZ9_9GAMM|nr:DUF4922 domain-containing protein [Photobacterium aquae]KLV08830.1 phosphorylase [Photobacterium aquae]